MTAADLPQLAANIAATADAEDGRFPSKRSRRRARRRAAAAARGPSPLARTSSSARPLSVASSVRADASSAGPADAARVSAAGDTPAGGEPPAKQAKRAPPEDSAPPPAPPAAAAVQAPPKKRHRAPRERLRRLPEVTLRQGGNTDKLDAQRILEDAARARRPHVVRVRSSNGEMTEGREWGKDEGQAMGQSTAACFLRFSLLLAWRPALSCPYLCAGGTEIGY